MDTIVPVFQFEIRYNHILNFSQIARKILSPYVKLAQSIKLENQNTINERIILNFEEEDYLIIVNWDRILIKGQGRLDTFTTKNSPIEMPFFGILDQIKNLEEFGSIQNVLLIVNHIKKIEIEKNKLLSMFMDKSILKSTSKVLDEITDIAITLERKKRGDETTISYGPYYGTSDLLRRSLIPVNIDRLDGTDFFGIMLEYKYFKSISNVTFSEFVSMIKVSNEIIDKVWKTL